MFHDRRRILINQGAIMTIETTSTSSSWSPQGVFNNGNTLIWEVSGGVTIAPTEINDPTFDFSTNTGTAIITAKDISNTTSLTIDNLGVFDININDALNLNYLSLRYGSLTSLDLTDNVNLERVFCNTNSITSLDISNNTLLTQIVCSYNQLTVLDLSNNTLLSDLRVKNNPLTSTSIDNIIITLDNHGLNNGTLELPTGRTSASLTAYNSLIAKNWTIDAGELPTMTIETTSTSSSWSPFPTAPSSVVFTWEVTGGVTIPPTEINDPTFDLSSNTGTAIVTLKDATLLERIGFTPYQSQATRWDLTQAVNLEQFGDRYALYTELDITKNVKLELLQVGNNNLTSIDTSNNPLLRTFWVDNNNITSVDISNNPAIINMQVNANPLTSTNIDNLLIDLDNHGLSNGTLQLPTGRTSASLTAYNSLIAKGWTITES